MIELLTPPLPTGDMAWLEMAFYYPGQASIAKDILKAVGGGGKILNRKAVRILGSPTPSDSRLWMLLEGSKLKGPEDIWRGVQLRSCFDQLLDFYGLLEIAVRIGAVQWPLVPERMQSVGGELNIPSFRLYYHQFRPSPLTVSLSERIGQGSPGISRGPDRYLMAEFHAILSTHANLAANPNIRYFLWFLNDVSPYGRPISGVDDVALSWSRLSHGFGNSRATAPQRVICGLFDFLSGAKEVQAIIARNPVEIFRNSLSQLYSPWIGAVKRRQEWISKQLELIGSSMGKGIMGEFRFLNHPKNEESLRRFVGRLHSSFRQVITDTPLEDVRARKEFQVKTHILDTITRGGDICVLDIRLTGLDLFGGAYGSNARTEFIRGISRLLITLAETKEDEISCYLLKGRFFYVTEPFRAEFVCRNLVENFLSQKRRAVAESLRNQTIAELEGKPVKSEDCGPWISIGGISNRTLAFGRLKELSRKGDSLIKRALELGKNNWSFDWEEKEFPFKKYNE